MDKIIKKYGNTVVISFDKEEMKILGVKVGDIVEVDKKRK